MVSRVLRSWGWKYATGGMSLLSDREGPDGSPSVLPRPGKFLYRFFDLQDVQRK
jgi:hypothetical protein